MVKRSNEAEKLGVFVSYSREDLTFTDQLVVTLELAGFAPSIDRIGIHGAEAWEEKLATLIREADTVVFVLSPASAQSKVCAWEVERAIEMGKRIVPVVCRPLAEVAPPPALAALNYIFFYADPDNPGSGWAAGMRELDRTLKTDLGWLREHTRLLQRAVEWEAGGKMPGRLLSGDDIRAARNWEACRPSEAPAPTALHIAFIFASEAHEAEQANAREQALAEREHLVAEAEASRAAREQAQAAALAAAEREAMAQRRVARRTSAGLVLALLLATAAGGAGWWAWVKQREAVVERERAVELQQRAEAESAKAADAVKVVSMLGRQMLERHNQVLTQEQRDRRLYGDLERAAEGGNYVAMRIAGLLAYDGRGVVQDYGRAREWWEVAAAAGDVAAMTNLGLLYANGQGLAQDFAKAREWYEKAAAAGNTGATRNLGLLYANGQGATQNFAKARKLLEQAAVAGDDAAMTDLGWYYAKGQGVARDFTKAREWYEKAAVAGQAVAMRNLGLLYANGQSVAQDFAKAREWYEKAAVAGDAAAMTNLGLLYANGQSVAQDFAQAREWYERAAAAGNAGAMRNLGLLYANGEGVTQDFTRAHTLLEKAAAAGDTRAMTNLGWYYAKGQGVAQDFAKAREWYEQAAVAGDADAKRSLTMLAVREAAAAGNHADALHLQEALAGDAEAAETKAAGKPGEKTASGLANVAWYALFAREPAKALAASERSLTLRPRHLATETNLAHALMLLGRAEEARALYLAHKDQPIAPDKLWQQAIAEDFAALRKAGIAHPQMPVIEAELGIGKP